MFNGKKKAVTFSYDDGTTQDIRLAALFHKYGLRATFNLNSARLGQARSLIREGVEINHTKVLPCDVRSIYAGHEIAAHTLNHPLLPSMENDAEIIRQVEEDRLRLSELAGYEVVGFAYPCGGKNYDRRVSKLLRTHTRVRYCRTIEANEVFGRQDNLYEFHPTIHHTHWDTLYTLAEQFLTGDAGEDQIFYIWGHSFEFDIFDDWDRFEEFCKLISGHPDIFYGTNREVLLP